MRQVGTGVAGHHVVDARQQELVAGDVLGRRRTTVVSAVRDTTTRKPCARSTAAASSSMARLTVDSATAWPEAVVPTPPGSMPPWPASRKTV